MKKTTLFIAIIAILTSCNKDENLLPVQQSPDNPSLRTSQNQHFLYNIEDLSKWEELNYLYIFTPSLFVLLYAIFRKDLVK